MKNLTHLAVLFIAHASTVINIIAKIVEVNAKYYSGSENSLEKKNNKNDD